MKTYPIKCRITAASAGPARVDVYDDIGGGDWLGGGISAADFAAQMASLKGPLDVHINSGGGDVFDGLAIAQAVRGHKGTVTTVVDGVAASIASVIFQAGQQRVMTPGSMLMIHDAFGGTVGNAAEVSKFAQTLDKVSDNLAAVYAERAGGTAAQWRAAMKDETWYTAPEAVEAGLADRAEGGTAALPPGLDLAAFSKVPGRIAAALRTLPVAAGARHEPMTGTHSHPHPAYGAQGGDAMHAHEHTHDGDADHGHSHDTPQDRAARLRAAAAAEEHGHPGKACFDPDGDGDCDLTPEGDTDHDYWSADGKQLKPLPGQPVDDALAGQIRALIREELQSAATGACCPACGPGCQCMGTQNHFIAADKYKQADRDRMAKSGEAMPDGSYPIADEEDLGNAIRAVGRGGADHDAIRKHIIKRAKALGLSERIPDGWNSDGSLKTSAGNHAPIDISGTDLEKLRDGLKGAFA